MAASNTLATRTKTSKVWEHFSLDTANKKITCKVCKAELAYHGSTSVMHEHLKRKHVGQLNETESDSPRQTAAAQGYNEHLTTDTESTNALNIMLLNLRYGFFYVKSEHLFTLTQSLTLITSEEQCDAQDQQHPGLIPGSVRPPSNMLPAWRRGRRTGNSTVPPRTMVTAGQTGQVWVSCWILLSGTCILTAHAQAQGHLHVPNALGAQRFAKLNAKIAQVTNAGCNRK
ncbi:hypothetical protein PAMP_008931 [Pampus punctatissimus]